MSDPANHPIAAERVTRIRCERCGQALDLSGLPPLALVECPDCHTRQHAPLRLNTFLLLQELGRGSMGVVYRALDESLKRKVAIKVLRRELGEDAAFVAGFMREARAAAAINHPHVVQIYSCGEARGQPYIVMELVDGGPLETALNTSHPVKESFLLRVAEEVSAGLKAAQDLGLIHGDIKPANILFDRQGAAKLADFGLAQFVRQQEAGEIWGTPYYIAPEKARGLKADHRSDIYSLGATMYHVLSGAPPFEGETAADVVVARLRQAPTSLLSRRPDLHPATEAVIDRMLAAEPQQRYPNYKSLISDLQEARAEAEAGPAPGKTSRRTGCGVRLALAAGVAVLAALLAWSGWRFLRPPESGQPEPAPLPEPAGAEAAPTAGEPEEPPPPELETKREPIDPALADEVLKALQRLSTGSSIGVGEALERIHERAEDRHDTRLWLRLLQAVAALADGQDQAARLYLDELLKSIPQPDDETLGETRRWAAALAHYLADSPGQEATDLESMAVRLDALLEDAPPALRDLAAFLKGMALLRQGAIEDAEEPLARYQQASPPPGEAGWPYGFQDAARAWLTERSAWLTLAEDARRRIADNEPQSAREALETFRESASVPFAALADELLAEARRREQEIQAAREREARRAHEARVAQEEALLTAARRTARPLLARKEFAEAFASLDAVGEQIETPEALATWQFLRRAFRRMATLKQFLIASLQQAPMPQHQPELGGSIVSAGSAGIRVRVGDHGELVRPWDRLSMPLFLRMAQYYISRADLPPAEKASHLAAAALLYFEAGAQDPAARLAAQAARENPELENELRALMRGLTFD